MDWKDPINKPVKPNVMGNKTVLEFPISDVVEYIDWNPFFQVRSSVVEIKKVDPPVKAVSGFISDGTSSQHFSPELRRDCKIHIIHPLFNVPYNPCLLRSGSFVEDTPTEDSLKSSKTPQSGQRRRSSSTRLRYSIV